MQLNLPRSLRFKESFWLVPALISAGALLLSVATTTLDESLDLDGLGSAPLGYSGGAEGARAFLITIAGSIITVAGVAFSITIAILALTSVQFGPRLIRNFVRDLGNQVVLGTFIATFLYCLVVLRTVRGPEEGEFVPYISVAVSSLLALASMGVLIYFIAHVSTSIQVMSIIAGIGKELDEAITRLYPEEAPGYRSSQTDIAAEAIFSGPFRHVAARRSGYINGVDYERLVSIAAGSSLRIRVPHHAGQFIPRGAALAEAVYDDGSLPNESALATAIVDAFQVADHRASDQDIEYYIDQLVEIAVRAQSPAINDPFTAMACVDRLGASLRHLVTRELPSPVHLDAAGVPRVISKTQTFQGALDAAFNLIRQYSSTSVPVSLRLIETLAVIGEHTSDPLEIQALQDHARMVEHSAREHMREQADIEALEERVQQAIKALKAPDDEAI